MENLWPKRLMPLDDRPNLEQIGLTLAAQARGIVDRTGGLVEGHIRERFTAPTRSWSMFIWPKNQPAKSYEFLVARTVSDDFPVVVEAFHLGERHRVTHAIGMEALRTTLKEIFANPASRRIVQVLAAESAGQELLEQPPNVGEEIAVAPESPRPITVGNILDANGKRVCNLNFFGVSGVASVDVLRELVAGTLGRSVSLLNDGFVVTIKFDDAVRVSLSKDEYLVLRAEAKRALSTAGHLAPP